jgi:hypothetical protein
VRAWVTPAGDLRMQISPVAEADIDRWRMLLRNLPVVNNVEVEAHDGRGATFAVAASPTARVLSQLRRVAVVEGDEIGNAVTGEVTVRLSSVDLPELTWPAAVAAPEASAPLDYHPPIRRISPSIPKAPAAAPAEAPELSTVQQDARVWRETFEAVVAHLDDQRQGNESRRGSLRDAFPRLRPVPNTPGSGR